jgi:hypothetical protein
MKKSLIAQAAAACFSSPYAAHADENQCQSARPAGIQKVNEYYDPRIKQVEDVIAEIRTKGGDPDKVAVKIGGKFYTLPQVLQKLQENKSLAITFVDKEINACEAELKPIQDVMNGFVVIATGGLSALAPGKMAYVDVSDILAGYPLGGPSALIPKLREDTFRTLGIGGDVAKFARDPFRCILNFGCP